MKDDVVESLKASERSSFHTAPCGASSTAKKEKYEKNRRIVSLKNKLEKKTDRTAPVWKKNNKPGFWNPLAGGGIMYFLLFLQHKILDQKPPLKNPWENIQNYQQNLFKVFYKKPDDEKG